MKLGDLIIEYQDNYYGFIGDADGMARLHSLQGDYAVSVAYDDLFQNAEMMTQDDVMMKLSTDDALDECSYNFFDMLYSKEISFPISMLSPAGKKMEIRRSCFGEFYEMRTPQQNGWTRVKTYWSDGQIDESYEKNSDDRDHPLDRKGHDRRNAR